MYINKRQILILSGASYQLDKLLSLLTNHFSLTLYSNGLKVIKFELDYCTTYNHTYNVDIDHKRDRQQYNSLIKFER